MSRKSGEAQGPDGDAGTAGQTEQGGAGPLLGGAGGALDEGEKVQVSGLVVAHNEQPVAGVKLRLGVQQLTSAADGSFAAEVTLPYDIVLEQPERFGSGLDTSVFLGVTRLDPKLYVRAEPPHTAHITGQITGGAAPAPLGSFTHLGLSSPDFLSADSYAPHHFWGPDFRVDPEDNGYFDSYSGSVVRPRWSGGTKVEATLLALEHDAQGVVTALGHRLLTLTNGQDVGSPLTDIALAPALLRDLKVTVSHGSEPSIQECMVAISLVSSIVSPDFECSSAGTTIQVPSNLPSAVSFLVRVNASIGYRRFFMEQLVPTDVSGLSIALPPDAPVAKEPYAGIVGTANSLVFSFAPVSAALSSVEFCRNAFNSNGMGVRACDLVYTNETSIALSKLLALGLKLPAGQNNTWLVRAHVEAPTLDEFLAPSRSARALSSYVSAAYLGEGPRGFIYEP